MTEKVYEMDDDYNQAMSDLLGFIKIRDDLAASLRNSPPDKLREGQELLGQMDKQIEKLEASLAKEYESYQSLRRTEEARDEKFDELAEGLAGAYVHAKYRNPEMIRQLDAVIGDMPPEEAEAFYKRAAQIEAGDLIRIIVRQGETREQTEEFLKNYRAGQLINKE